MQALSLAALALLALPSAAQVLDPGPGRAPRPDFRRARQEVRALLEPHGAGSFSPQFVEALTTFAEAEELWRRSDFATAKARLDDLWLRYPPGDPSWSSLPFRPFGLNLGWPTAYYGLRMLSDMTDWRVGGGTPDLPTSRTVRMTVLVAGQSSGIEPRTVAEIQSGTGVPVLHEVDARLTDRVIRESLLLFQDYIGAMTQGGLRVEADILRLPATNLDVHAHVLGTGGYYAGLVDASTVFASVPDTVRDETDWWWLLYPSHVPEQHAPFASSEFITGGMGAGPGGSPMFLIDDRWLVRKPPHLGSGPYSALERRVYLPQWLQHEFFHHLYRTWPEFGLEDAGHQWFDLSTWPADFVGRYEADYYHESLVRRLQGATPGLQAGLRYATAGAPWDQLDVTDVLGTFRREPVQNPWHVGTIGFQGTQLRWLNTAGVAWNLTPDVGNGLLLTGPDCPYFTQPDGQSFEISLERDALGDFTGAIEGFTFLRELYRAD